MSFRKKILQNIEIEDEIMVLIWPSPDGDDSPQCGEMSRSDKGDRRPSGGGPANSRWKGRLFVFYAERHAGRSLQKFKNLYNFITTISPEICAINNNLSV